MRRQRSCRREAKLPLICDRVQARSQYLELCRLVVATAGIDLGGTGLLEVDLWQPLLRAGQDVLAFDKKSAPAIFDFEVRLAVLDDVSHASNAGYLAEMAF